MTEKEKEDVDPQPDPLGVDEDAEGGDESKVAEMAKKLSSATVDGIKKASPVVVDAAKKGAHLAVVGGKKGAKLAATGTGKARDLVMGFWRNATSSEEPLNEDTGAEAGGE
jgi:hypothetical protein